MRNAKKKPCGSFVISYIKITYDKDGNVVSVTVKATSPKAK